MLRKLFAMVAVHYEYSMIVMTSQTCANTSRKYHVVELDYAMYSMNVTLVVSMARL